MANDAEKPRILLRLVCTLLLHFSIVLCILTIPGCRSAKKDVSPEPVTFYFVPDWKTYTAERKELISSLPGEHALFMYETLPPGNSQPGLYAVPDHSCVREMKDITFLFISTRSGVPSVPLDWKKGTPPSYPLIAFIRGRLPDRALARAHKRFSPDVYIFLGDHYENIGEIHSVPAFSAGTDTLSSPFTGDFPCILRIRAIKGDVSVRPIDRQGFILKTDAVTSRMIFGLNMLKHLCDISLTLKEWEAPFEHTFHVSFINPLRKTVTLRIASQDGPASAWTINPVPTEITVRPGAEGTIEVSFHLENVNDYKPVPKFIYTIYVGGEKVWEGRKNVKVTYYPKPGSNAERGMRNAEVQEKR